VPRKDESEPFNPYVQSTRSINGIESSVGSSTLPYLPPEYLTTGEINKLTDSDAILLASNYCKDSPFKWQNEALVKIGLRTNKWTFLVKGVDTESSKTVPMILSMINISDMPISLTNPTTVEVYANLVCGLSNHYLLSCEEVDYIKDRSILIVIRKFCDRGSLKDLIFGKQNPKDLYRQKYHSDNGRPLRQKILRTFGRHVLEGLSALSMKGIVCDHLKTSNVLIDSTSIARISDFELMMLGNGINRELLEILTEYEIRREASQGLGRVSRIDVLLFGLVLLEMATGISIHRNSFQTEVDDHFCERVALGGSDNEPVRDILRMIFNPSPEEEIATIESLLLHPYFQVSTSPLPPPPITHVLSLSLSRRQGVELSMPSQKLKFQSVEKGLIKSAMLAAAEKRRQLKEELLKQEEKRQQDRTQVASEYEDVTLANEIVNKRRNKSFRKGSLTSSGSASTAPSTTSSSSSPTSPQKVSRRQSTKKATGGVPANSLASSSSSQPVLEDENSQSNPLHTSSSPALPMEPEGVHSSIPPAYQRLLQMGLSQEQVCPSSPLPSFCCSWAPSCLYSQLSPAGHTQDDR
jgi:hypothetical protein